MCSPPNIRFAAQYSTGKFNKDRNFIYSFSPILLESRRKKKLAMLEQNFFEFQSCTVQVIQHAYLIKSLLREPKGFYLYIIICIILYFSIPECMYTG